jgi:5-(aminomethyl)-3-furanmethanol phosphate kinase
VRPVVVKLGGSLAAAGTLRSWLDILCRHGAGRAVVVPGGGSFADAVRAAQQRQGFSARAAHHMALLAMHQYALMLADMAPALRPAESASEIGARLSEGGIGLWLPYRMVAADPMIAESWQVTSDSLAAWLAGRLAAERLVLVKSAAAPMPRPAAAELAARGLVDPAFPGYVERAAAALFYCGPGEEQRLAEALQLG